MNLVEGMVHPSGSVCFLENIFYMFWKHIPQKGKRLGLARCLGKDQSYLLLSTKGVRRNLPGMGGLKSRRAVGMTQSLPHPTFKPGIPSEHQEPRPGSLPSCAFGFSGLKGEHKEEGPGMVLLWWWDHNTDSGWSPVCCVWPPTYLLKPGPDRWFLTSIHSKPYDVRCLETLSFWSNIYPAEFVLFT